MEADVKTHLSRSEDGGGERAFQKGIVELGELTPFMCPDCHGVLVRIAEERFWRRSGSSREGPSRAA